jgi:hypothetical protein
MKPIKNDTTAAAASPEAKPVPAPKPAFSPSRAVGIAPRRHEGTARTAAFVQAEGEKLHLYSYAGDYIATVTGAEAESFTPKPSTPAA